MCIFRNAFIPLVLTLWDPYSTNTPISYSFFPKFCPINSFQQVPSFQELPWAVDCDCSFHFKMNLNFTTISMWWIFLLVLFLPPPYCSLLLLLFTNSGFVLTVTEIQKGASCSQKRHGPNPALRINPSNSNRGVSTDSPLDWMHYTWGGFVLPIANNHDEEKLLFNPQALNSKAARNITFCSAFSLLEWLPKRTSCFQPGFRLHLQEFILSSYPSFSFHNPAPFWSPKGLFLSWMKTNDQVTGRCKLECSNLYGETAPRAQSSAKRSTHGCCLAIRKLHVSHCCLFPRR